MEEVTSFNVVNLYPSIPIDEAVAVIIEMLNNDIDNLRKQTKLTVTDIYKIIELYLKALRQIVWSLLLRWKNALDWKTCSTSMFS